MLSFKYESSQMIAREKFTGVSPEIIMEKFCCKILLMHVASVTVINEHTELWEVANQLIPGSE